MGSSPAGRGVPPSRPATNFSAFVEQSQGKHWSGGMAGHREQASGASGQRYDGQQHAVANHHTRASNTRVPSASRMARLRHLDEKVGRASIGRHVTSGRKQTVSIGEVFEAEGLFAARGTKSMLSPRVSSARRQYYNTPQSSPYLRERPVTSDDAGQARGSSGRASKPGSARKYPQSTMATNEAAHVPDPKLEQETACLGVVAKTQSLDNALIASLESLYDIAWDDGAGPADDSSSCSATMTDPALHGFLTAWTEKDPCSFVTGMANRFYPPSTQEAADAEARRKAIFDALDLDLAQDIPEVKQRRPRKQSSFHLSSETRSRTLEECRVSSPVPRLDLKTLSTENSSERVIGARRNGKGNYCLQESTDDDIRPHRRNSTGILESDSGLAISASMPPSWNTRTSADSIEAYGPPNWRPDSNFLQQRHHYHQDMRVNPGIQRIAIIAANKALGVPQQPEAIFKGGDLGRFPVREVSSLDAERLPTGASNILPFADRAGNGRERQFYTPRVLQSFVPSRPPMQNEKRTHPAHLSIPSRNGSGTLNPVGSVGHRSLFNVARNNNQTQGRPATSASGSASQNQQGAQHQNQNSTHVRTFGNQRAVPLLMARSSTSIRAFSPASNMVIGGVVNTGSSQPHRDLTWPSNHRRVSVITRDGFAY